MKDERKTYFVDVIVPIPVKGTFTYRIPFELNNRIKTGVRVVVPFGKSKYYSAIVTRVHEEIPDGYQSKYIETILDEEPIVTPYQLKIWGWMAKYYVASLGEVMNVALPSNLKLASETKIALHPNFEPSNKHFENEHFQTIIDALEIKETLDLSEISKLLKIKTVHPIIKKMMDEKIIISTEELSYKYRDKTATYIFLEEEYQELEVLSELIDQYLNSKSKKSQGETLLRFLDLCMNDLSTPVSKSDLEKENISTSSINTLSKNGVFHLEKLKINRFEKKDHEAISKEVILSKAQDVALRQIQVAFTDKKTVLLHGVTGSGKTEIYIQLIKKALNEGKQVLYLLPEIALTAQLIQRLKKYFGDLVGVYHSKFNQNERVEIWNHVLYNDPKQFRIVLGARSSLFLPFANLGLIIVDEEHETSFKQFEPSPRYNARDMAIVLSGLFKADCILGSATPSFESYHNALNGKYTLVELSERFGGASLPTIYCADTKSEKENDTMVSDLTSVLMEQIKHALAHKSQVILFQNRRGYTPTWSCEMCNWTPKCINCDVSLTYHKFSNQLKCHYCGYTEAPMGSCKNCGSHRLHMLGFGTEKIEDELSAIFPSAHIKRMDLDTTRSKNAYETIIDEFEHHKIDILVGTQMLTKGLDFGNVSLVGILDADLMLNRPDFRAFERSFQLMSQVAGRSGRKDKKGTVIVQTGQPAHWVIQKIIQHDYKGFYDQEIKERERFMYPPFYKLITITLKNKDVNILNEAAYFVANELRQILSNRILGPEFPLIKRINNLYLKEITIKIEKELSPLKVKEKISEIINQMYAQVPLKSTRTSINVDPI